jgi:AcrR family transcriptional regulator
MGRPREFDVEKAVDTAANLFWRKGYDRTSLADLTDAIGITPPSFYFAFGSKEGLFEKVLDHYLSGHLSYFDEALREPTARRVVERLFYGYANGHTDPGRPPGCLGVNCALPCPEDADAVRKMLASVRKKTAAKLRKRLKEARESGDLPPDADPDVLAHFIQTIGWGMAVDAQSGATRKDLHRTVALALKAWPT